MNTTTTTTEIQDYLIEVDKEQIFDQLSEIKNGQIVTLRIHSEKKKKGITLIEEKYIQIRIGVNYENTQKVKTAREDGMQRSTRENTYERISPALVWNSSSKTVQVQGAPLGNVRKDESAYYLVGADGEKNKIEKAEFDTIRESLFSNIPSGRPQLYQRVKLENVLSIN